MQVSRRTLLLGSVSIGVTSRIPPSRIEAARQVVRDLLAATPVPAFSVAVYQHDAPIWAEAFGKADLELDIVATSAHRFRLGSVSKAITATLAAVLAERGGVDLDAPIARYMPELPEQHRSTTARQLLTHRGGIRHYNNHDFDLTAPGGSIDNRNYASSADILGIFVSDPLIARPGERVSYSTFGYSLVSLVLEAAARTPFPELIQSEIARPLALKSLGPDAPRSIVPARVPGYIPRAQAGWARPAVEGPWANASMNNPAYKWAGGGLLATPTDLALFGAAHLAPGKLSRSILDALFTVHTQATENSPPLGLGWRIDEDPAKRLRWHHAGGQDGARASLVVYPKENLSIALATNLTGTPGDVNGASAKIADALLGV